MKEHPIIFSAPMVQAILDGRKTQTRRVMRTQPHPSWNLATVLLDGTAIFDEPYGYDVHKFRCPYEVGMRLWVRETFQQVWDPEPIHEKKTEIFMKDVFPNWATRTKTPAWGTNVNYWVYRADGEPNEVEDLGKLNWQPSIFMPRKASRITLEIINIRVERLQNISYADCEAEGANDEEFISFQEDARCVAPPGSHIETVKEHFAYLWDSINGKKPGCAWADNCYVWVLEFKRV